MRLRRAPRFSRRCHGFTLLELMIALALSGLLLALLSQAIGGLRLASQRVDQNSLADDERQRGRDMVTLLLSGAIPAQAGDSAGGFSGTADGIEFMTSPPQALAHSGPLRVRLSVSPTTASQVGVYVEMESVRGAVAGTVAQPRQLLIAGLNAARFDYAERGDTPLAPQWASNPQPPGLVRLRLVRAGAEEASEQVLVAVRKQQASGCRIDPISLTCRPADGP